MPKIETSAPITQPPAPTEIKNVNLKKALKGKNWLLYNGENTLIVDDVKNL